MAKRMLITEATVRAAAKAGQTTLAHPPDALITALARDTAREKGLLLVVQAPPAATPTAKSGCGCAKTDCCCSSARPRIVALGSDHGGYGYKEALKPLLADLGWQILDLGTDDEKSCDYPDFAYAVARAVTTGRAGFGVMIDGAGIGSAMVCNKVPGARAACAYNSFTAWNARAHNDANVLTLGSRTLGIEVCKQILRTFLATDFEGGRHVLRVGKIDDLDQRREGIAAGC